MHDYLLQYVTTSNAHPHLQEQHIVYTTGADKRVSWPSKRAEYKHEYIQPPAAHSRDHQKWTVTNPVHQYRSVINFPSKDILFFFINIMPDSLMLVHCICIYFLFYLFVRVSYSIFLNKNI